VATLRLEEGSRKREIELALRTRITAGRAPENLIVLKDTAASRVHCAVERRGDEWWLTDLESRNGTRRNGEAVTSARLAPGDRIEIGRARIIFIGDEGADVESSGLASFARSLGPNETAPASRAADAAFSVPALAEAAERIHAAVARGVTLGAALDAVEKEVISRALSGAAGNRSEAARRLGISRPGLLKKMKRLGLRQSKKP
jgi:DNA-binding NtrC family response regulator